MEYLDGHVVVQTTARLHTSLTNEISLEPCPLRQVDTFLLPWRPLTFTFGTMVNSEF